ncbi:MAG: MsnO8 family LLM class oxidoreductase [Candidatus Lustribacter sp.]|jgi:luciferase family oxidoreductase group 1
MSLLPLSILDQSPVFAHSSPEEAIASTIALVREAEQLGYARYWFAEHHGKEHNFTSAAPEILIARMSAETRRIRLGSGGVLLSHYSALKVAESFRLLEAIAPGRIDLGVGRGTGSNEETELALRSGIVREGAFDDRLAELLGLLEKRASEAAPFPGVVATPVVSRVPQTWLLGSTANGARLAGTLGLSFAYAHFINGDGPQVTAAYREAYRPSTHSQQPRVLVTVAAFCSSDAGERSDYLATLALRRARMRLEHDPLPPTREEARTHVPTIEESDQIEKTLRLAVAADPASIRKQLQTLAERHTADELMIVSVTPDAESRRKSYEALADVWS